MYLVKSLGALIALGTLAAARDGCGEIEYQYKYHKASSFPAKVAAQCLREVPFDSELALYTTEQMRLFTQLYSAQAWFYDPPPSKLKVKAVNLNETFDEIEKKASRKDGYRNQYDFQYDIMKLFGDIKDGHVQYRPNCATNFYFLSNHSIILLRNEDQDYPAVHYLDMKNGDIGKQVEKIGGWDAIDYLEELALTLPETSWIDQDARFNELFASMGPGGRINPGLFAVRTLAQTEDIPIEYTDGSKTVASWVAFSQAEITWKDADEYYKHVCLDPEYEDIIHNPESLTHDTPTGTHDIQAVPSWKPDDLHIFDRRSIPDEFIGRKLAKRDSHDDSTKPGAFDDVFDFHVIGEKKDIAVLRIYGFLPSSAASGVGGEDTMAVFKKWWDYLLSVEAYLDANKIEKMIIDVRGNGGGMVYLGFLTVHFLFPEAHPFYAQDHRRSPLMDLLVRTDDNKGVGFDYRNNRKSDNTEYKSVEEYLGPVYKYHDYFTTQSRWNIDDAFDEGFEFMDALQRTTPVLDINNIIIFSDGNCGSTCAIFTEALTNIGVKAITTGGVPEHKYEKMMQPVGGIKGSQVLDWDALHSNLKTLQIDPSKYDYVPKRLPFMHSSRINLKNSYEPGSDIPLEFVYQPGNSHIWQTPKYWQDETLFWEAAAAEAWDTDGANVLPDVQGGLHGPHDDHGGVNRNHLSPNKADINGWGYAITQQFENYGWSFHV